MEITNEWSSVGEYSIKTVLVSWGYARIYTVFNSPYPSNVSKVTFTCNVDYPVRAVLLKRKSSDNSEYANDYLDITEGGTYTIESTLEEPYSRLELRFQNRRGSSEPSVTVYVDNIIFY